MLKLAVIIGHNAQQPGATAVAPVSESEYPFNVKIADLMVRLAEAFGIEIKKIERPYLGPYRRFGVATGNYTKEVKTAYQECDAWGADISTELHFNAAGPTARGSEVLASGSTNSMEFARLTQKGLVKAYNRQGRHDRGVKPRSPKERGGISLHSGKAPAILVEPFFGSNDEDCALTNNLGAEGLAKIYLTAAQEYAQAKGFEVPAAAAPINALDKTPPEIEDAIETKEAKMAVNAPEKIKDTKSTEPVSISLTTDIPAETEPQKLDVVEQAETPSDENQNQNTATTNSSEPVQAETDAFKPVVPLTITPPEPRPAEDDTDVKESKEEPVTANEADTDILFASPSPQTKDAPATSEPSATTIPIPTPPASVTPLVLTPSSPAISEEPKPAEPVPAQLAEPPQPLPPEPAPSSTTPLVIPPKEELTEPATVTSDSEMMEAPSMEPILPSITPHPTTPLSSDDALPTASISNKPIDFVSQNLTRDEFLVQNDEAFLRTIVEVNMKLANQYSPVIQLTKTDIWVVGYAEIGLKEDLVDPDHLHSEGARGLFPLPSNITFWNGGDALNPNQSMSLKLNIEQFLLYLGNLKNKVVTTVQGRALYRDLFLAEGIKGDAVKEAAILTAVVHGYFYSGAYTPRQSPPYDQILSRIAKGDNISSVMAQTKYKHAGTPVINQQEKNMKHALELVTRN
ncbi:MAG: N-acetylmuramoyl-L-alanine amidase [Verrucomicrobiota bacterium]